LSYEKGRAILKAAIWVDGLNNPVQANVDARFTQIEAAIDRKYKDFRLDAMKLKE